MTTDNITHAILKAQDLQIAKIKARTMIPYAYWGCMGLLATGAAIAALVLATKYTFDTTVIEKTVITTSTSATNNSVTLPDGTKVYSNGTVVKSDGTVTSTVATAGGKAKDTIRIINKGKAGPNITNYTLFAHSPSGQSHLDTISTGYSYDLTDTKAPISQWCIARTRGDLAFSFQLGDVSKNGTTKWATITDDVTTKLKVSKQEVEGFRKLCQFVSIGDKRFTHTGTPPEELTNMVEHALSSFKRLSGDHELVNGINILYGAFETDTNGDATVLGSCTLGGTTMHINIDALKDTAPNYVASVVFHELAHCVYAMDHNSDGVHIMNPMNSDKVSNQNHQEWMNDIQRLR